MTIMHLVLHVRHIGNYFMKLCEEEIAPSILQVGNQTQ